MGHPGIVARPVGGGNFEASVQFLTGWVSDGAAEARAYLAGHAEPAGASLIAVHGDEAAGYAAILWESNFVGFRDRGIPLVRQLAVARPFRRHGVAALLMDAAEQLAGERGVTTLGITVGLFDLYPGFVASLRRWSVLGATLAESAIRISLRLHPGRDDHLISQACESGGAAAGP